MKSNKIKIISLLAVSSLMFSGCGDSNKFDEISKKYDEQFVNAESNSTDDNYNNEIGNIKVVHSSDFDQILINLNSFIFDASSISLDIDGLVFNEISNIKERELSKIPSIVLKIKQIVNDEYSKLVEKNKPDVVLSYCKEEYEKGLKLVNNDTSKKFQLDEGYKICLDDYEAVINNSLMEIQNSINNLSIDDLVSEKISKNKIQYEKDNKMIINAQKIKDKEAEIKLLDIEFEQFKANKEAEIKLLNVEKELIENTQSIELNEINNKAVLKYAEQKKKELIENEKNIDKAILLQKENAQKIKDKEAEIKKIETYKVNSELLKNIPFVDTSIEDFKNITLLKSNSKPIEEKIFIRTGYGDFYFSNYGDYAIVLPPLEMKNGNKIVYTYMNNAVTTRSNSIKPIMIETDVTFSILEPSYYDKNFIQNIKYTYLISNDRNSHYSRNDKNLNKINIFKQNFEKQENIEHRIYVNDNYIVVLVNMKETREAMLFLIGADTKKIYEAIVLNNVIFDDKIIRGYITEYNNKPFTIQGDLKASLKYKSKSRVFSGVYDRVDHLMKDREILSNRENILKKLYAELKELESNKLDQIDKSKEIEEKYNKLINDEVEKYKANNPKFEELKQYEESIEKIKSLIFVESKRIENQKALIKKDIIRLQYGL